MNSDPSSSKALVSRLVIEVDNEGFGGVIVFILRARSAYVVLMSTNDSDS